MKYQVTRFKNLVIALKEIEPFVRDGNHLVTGRPFQKFGELRSREILGNWLICAVLNANAGKDCFTFTSDPQRGDGVIVNFQTNASWLTEHVMVGKPRTPHETESSIECRVLQAYNSKVKKGGPAYAAGKTLIIFLYTGGGEWYPRKVAQRLPKDLVYADVWIFSLLPLENGKYVYGVAQLGDPERQAPTWVVRIDDHFGSWGVTCLQ